MVCGGGGWIFGFAVAEGGVGINSSPGEDKMSAFADVELLGGFTCLTIIYGCMCI